MTINPVIIFGLLLVVYMILPDPIRMIVNLIAVAILLILVSAYVDEWMREKFTGE